MRRNRLRTVALALGLAAAGCAAQSYKVHPGAANTFDSQAYDSLIIAKAGIDQAKTEIQTNPKISKEYLNDAVKAYNAARGVYLTYHNAAASGGTNAAQLQADLTNALGALTAALGKVQTARGVTP